MAGGDTGDVACDHYHRFAEDVALMRDLGVGAYRFSVSWPRVLPDGRGRVNTAGLDFYRRLVDALLEAGITPFCTLYHWDLPQALQDAGGWLNRDTAQAFAEYAHVMVGALGDRVADWMTFNEPWCIAYLGHVTGEHAPGHRDPTHREANHVAHHVNVAHGLTVPVLRDGSPGARVGIAFNLTPVHPATDTPADRLAARRVDVQLNRWFTDPVLRGEYPLERLERLDIAAWPPLRDGDQALISAPLDFVGVNYYTRVVVADDPQARDPTVAARLLPGQGEPTAMGWEVYPDGLREVLAWMHRTYHPAAIHITENGCAYDDGPHVRDTKRIAYLDSHIRAAGRAIADGVPLRGYFVWSLLDNFEWAHGYDRRFGLVHVDFATQARTPKASFAAYRAVIAAGAPSHQPERASQT